MKKISLAQYANTLKIKIKKQDNKFFIEDTIGKLYEKRIDNKLA